MELLNETLDLLEKYEKGRKNTVSLNSVNTVVQKDDEKGNKENNNSKRLSTAESSVTRINSVDARSSKSIELRSNCDSDSEHEGFEEDEDEEFKSFPDDSLVSSQNDKENINYDTDYYEYLNQKNGGRKRFNSMPSSERPYVQRSRSNSSLSTPELLIYDSNEYDSSSSYGSINGGRENIRPPQLPDSHDRYLNGNNKKIFLNNQLIENNEKLDDTKKTPQNKQGVENSDNLLNVMDKDTTTNNNNTNNTNTSTDTGKQNYLSVSSSSDFVIPLRSHSLVEDEITKRIKAKSYISPSSSPKPSVKSLQSPKMKRETLKVNMDDLKVQVDDLKKGNGNQNGDSSITIPLPSPTTPTSPSLPASPSSQAGNDSFIGPMSRSFSINQNNNISPNISYNDHNLRPISSLYRQHSLGSHDQRLSRALNNRYSSYENCRSRSMSPNHHKPTLDALPGNINADGGVSRGYSSSTPPDICKSHEKNIKEAVASPLTRETPNLSHIPLHNTNKNDNNQYHESYKNSDVKSDLPHIYTSHSSVESETNVKEAGYHEGHSLIENHSQIMDKSFFEQINRSGNPNDQRKSVLTSTSTTNSIIIPPSIPIQGGKKNSLEINNGLLTPQSIPGTPDLGFNLNLNSNNNNSSNNNHIHNTNVSHGNYDGIRLPISKRKSSIPNPPPLILMEEPMEEPMEEHLEDLKREVKNELKNEPMKEKQQQQQQQQFRTTSFQKFSEKEVFSTLMDLLNQMEDNQNKTDQKLISDAPVQRALDNLVKSYFPEGLNSNDEAPVPKYQAPVGNLPNTPRSPIPKNSMMIGTPKLNNMESALNNSMMIGTPNLNNMESAVNNSMMIGTPKLNNMESMANNSMMIGTPKLNNMESAVNNSMMTPKLNNMESMVNNSMMIGTPKLNNMESMANNSMMIGTPKLNNMEKLDNKLLINGYNSGNESEGSVRPKFKESKKFRDQRELQQILNYSSPSLVVKSKKERAKQQQHLRLIQQQQKQEMRVKMIQQQQQQQLQNHLKQQISQKVQQNAMIQQKLKQLNNKNSMGSPAIKMMTPELDFHSPNINNDFDYNDFNDFSDNNNNNRDSVPPRFDSIVPIMSPASSTVSMDNIAALSPRPRKTSFNNGLVSPYQSVLSPLNSNNSNQKSPLFSMDKAGIPVTNELQGISVYPHEHSVILDGNSMISGSKVSLVKTKPNKVIPPINTNSNNRISPNMSFTRMSMMVPTIGVSPTIQDKSFSFEINNNSTDVNGSQQRLHNKSPFIHNAELTTTNNTTSTSTSSSTTSSSTSTSEKKRKDRSKKTSIFYMPPDNNSKPLSAIVSDVSDVSDVSINSEELDTITKNNTIINSNSNAQGYKYRNSLYKNMGYNLSADNLNSLKENSEGIAPLRKSNSIGSQRNNYGIMDDERHNQFTKFDANQREGETFIDSFLNEINASTGFENNIIHQKAQEDLAIRRELEMRRRTMNMNMNMNMGKGNTSANLTIGSPSSSININPSNNNKKEINSENYSYGSYGHSPNGLANNEFTNQYMYK